MTLYHTMLHISVKVSEKYNCLYNEVPLWSDTVVFHIWLQAWEESRCKTLKGTSIQLSLNEKKFNKKRKSEKGLILVKYKD